LAEKGLLRGKHRLVKVLADGSLTKPLTIRAHRFSATAKEKIEASGGKAEVIAVHA
jgi:large subunit ribosomal protein L15